MLLATLLAVAGYVLTRAAWRFWLIRPGASARRVETVARKDRFLEQRADRHLLHFRAVGHDAVEHRRDHFLEDAAQGCADL